MITAILEAEVKEITVEDIVSALQRVPAERLPDILQFIEFVEYRTSLVVDNSAEDEALWAAVEANQEYKRQHPGEELERYSSGEDFLKAVADL